MKMNKMAVIFLSAISLSSTVALAATTVNGGTVHFKGEVVNAGCAVDTGAMDQTVQMGQVRSALLSSAGKMGSSVGFNIQLNDCDTSVSTKASIAFSGTSVDSTNTSVLALQSASAGGARNVGIQILDRTGTPLVLDGNSFSAADELIDGTNIIPFQARYYATGVATAGTANADATFKVQYQ